MRTFRLLFLIFLLPGFLSAQNALKGAYEGEVKGERMVLRVEALSGSSISGTVTSTEGTFPFDGAIFGREIQSAIIHWKFHNQTFRGRFLEVKLALTFDYKDEFNGENKQVFSDFTRVAPFEQPAFRNDSALVPEFELRNEPERDTLPERERDLRLIGSWSRLNTETTGKGPSIQILVYRTVTVYYKDGSCGTGTGKKQKAEERSTGIQENIEILRDTATEWYTKDGVLYFVERNGRRGVLYSLRYRFEGAKLYVLNQKGQEMLYSRWRD